MRFDIVSHACMSVEAAGKRLVIDPWLIGSVYWGAWWHCPQPVYDDSIFDTDYLYITHWHFDHMHRESLRHFNKRCHILVPKFPVSIMAEQFRKLGFLHITELPHGESLEMGDGFRITSYQITYQDDSVCFVEADGVVLADINDAKPMPGTWKQLRETYPAVDFMFRSHSPAWSYPSAYRFDEPADAIPVTRETYMEAFRSAASILTPAFAVPFASSVCHPHREVLFENAAMISAFELRDYLAGNPVDQTDVRIMPPGSSWSDDAGFDIRTENAVRDMDAYVAQHSDEIRPWLEELYAVEDDAELKFETFETFFRGFLRSLVLPARPFLKIKFVFVVDQEHAPQYWSVSFRSGRIERHAEEPTDATSVIAVSPAVLDDALRNFIFTNIDISKRWKVQVRRGGLTKHLVACVLIALYEAGYLHIRNLLRWRFVSGIVARRSEVLDYLKLCVAILRRGPNAAADAVTDPL